ncbi:MAG TPA: MerR family transcriptional regulator [Bryobacteraceae bacterium]|nr:MerR family transcriptional regulator [Bryobacteraceae bacterium]
MVSAGKAMAYTVKQVAAMSGVSVRTLHFYDETGLLKPAYYRANGYRVYEEPQLLVLQQILFYRELGFELKEIKRILDRPDFENAAALESHRQVLEKSLSRTRRLLETIDKTIQHLKGTRHMKSEEMFAGFRVAAGNDRFGEHIKLGGEWNDCKVSAQDTEGAMCIFEFTGTGGGPRHLHHEQDEWIYVIDGEVDFVAGAERLRLTAGESIFIPRKTAHIWTCMSGRPAKIINVYQPAGKMEEFFREVSTFKNLPTREDVINKTYTEEQVQALDRLFGDHGMDLLGPPVLEVDKDGRITQIA